MEETGMPKMSIPGCFCQNCGFYIVQVPDGIHLHNEENVSLLISWQDLVRGLKNGTYVAAENAM